MLHIPPFQWLLPRLNKKVANNWAVIAKTQHYDFCQVWRFLSRLAFKLFGLNLGWFNLGLSPADSVCCVSPCWKDTSHFDNMSQQVSVVKQSQRLPLYKLTQIPLLE